ncbi:MAG TPA: polysaccharide biosynthesis tyrosine autokinase [Scandinavium sp.]|jgi:tyrosine-protein kinase Etk/Wzc|uniref:polysaccharide biosynthesis tyrosine autokinase n=1 Tax=Scandinavium sp. TaxID=2830653 RepID=UPI002E3512FE|nr:polysaccharide biosynthesis tyrosine autokinase [Scandinavium sp.]HEX4501655.1 polysaccharide biosynthesis tyrosine autokinase [Scandinavium sp.]
MSSTNTAHYPQKNPEEINLGELLGELVDHYKLIIAISAFFTLVALFYAFTVTPVYQANALIEIEQKQANSLLNNLSQILPDSQPQSAPEITLLQSRMILGKTIDDLGLQIKIKRRYTPVIGSLMAKLTDEKPGNVKIAELQLPTGNADNAVATLEVMSKDTYRLSGKDFELKAHVGERLQKEGVSILVTQIDAEPGARFSVTWLTRLKAIADLQENFNVADRGRDTGMLNLTMTGENPQLITDTLNSISDHYLAQNIARQAAQDEKSLEFLNAQLPKIRSELDAAEGKLNDYRKQKDSVDLNMEAKSVLEQIVNVDNQLNELTFREAEVSQLYKKDHPTYRALMEKRQTLQGEKAKLTKRVSSMPSTQQEVLRMSRDVDSNRIVYQQLLNRQQELNVTKSSSIGNVRIIDDAVTLPKPIKPKKALIVMIGLLFGGFISITCVLLKAALHKGIVSPDDLEDKGVDVYACIPYSEWLSKHNNKSRQNESDVLLAVQNPADPAIESLRGLRTSLYFTMMQAKNNVLMISGTSPGSGKTFISSNLAAVFAQTEKKVLLIDADLRKGYLHSLLGLEEKTGLAEILCGKKTFEQAVVTPPGMGIDFIARGHIPPNPAELLISNQFKRLLEKISPLYDLVIIDTPPIMAVTDATIVGRHADTVLMVARFEENTVKEVMTSMRRFEQNGIEVKGWILNGIQKRASSYYRYGHSPYAYKYNEKN